MRKQGARILGTRLKFKSGFQRRFISEIKIRSKSTWQALAESLDIGVDTLKRDFYCERTTIPKDLALQMLEKYPFETLENLEKKWIENILEGNWGQKKAVMVNKKKIIFPIKSLELAELFGVVLGDGHLNTRGLRITGNALEARHYEYISSLIKRLFGLKSKIYTSYTNSNTIVLNVYSRELANFLLDNGIKFGDKIREGSSLPTWIFEKPEFIFSALRGLLDTDGGVYYKQKGYQRAFIEFQTASPFIQNDIIYMLKSTGFVFSKGNNGLNVRIQNQEDLSKFFKLIGSSNPKNIVRYLHFLESGEIPLKDKLISEISNYNGSIPFKMQS